MCHVIQVHGYSFQSFWQIFKITGKFSVVEKNRLFTIFAKLEGPTAKKLYYLHTNINSGIVDILSQKSSLYYPCFFEIRVCPYMGISVSRKSRYFEISFDHSKRVELIPYIFYEINFAISCKMQILVPSWKFLVVK